MVISTKYTRKILFGALFFLIALLPILQFIPAGTTIVAERYTYIPSIGTLFIIATFIYWFYSKQLKHLISKAMLITLLIAITLTLSFLTYNRCKVWKDSMSLWIDALANDSGSAVIYNNVGIAYSDQGEHDKAILNYNKALKIFPYYSECYNNKGVSLANKNEYSKALIEFNKALKLNPDYFDPYYNIAKIYKIFGNHLEVIRFCKKAFEINPNDTKVCSDLCAAYGNIGNFKEAIQACSRTVELNPLLAVAHYNLSVAYYFDKQYDLAIQHCDKAIKLGSQVDPKLLNLLKPYRK